MLERLYRRTVPPTQVTTNELTTFLCECSAAIRRQVGVLLDRRGHVEQVIVGDAHKLEVPNRERVREGHGRLRGVRLLHTHLTDQPLDRDDLTDLTLLSLDLIAAVTMDAEGQPDRLHVAHLLPHDPAEPKGRLWEVLAPVPWHALELRFDRFVQALESEFRQKTGARRAEERGDRAIVVHVVQRSDEDTDATLGELRELARTAGIHIVAEVVQRRDPPDPRFVVGKGKLEELILQAMHREVELVIFNRELTPTQARTIADKTELRVIDRTQLILEIFAQRATTRAGKRRVELAQLKYALPRLVEMRTDMSRLTGGIRARGPGETKQEQGRRRAQDRIRQLEREITKLRDERERRRRLRDRRGMPVIGIVGYTNAGKSTMLNALTQSDVLAEDKLFATLDPTSRRLRFPTDREVILSDTVGFIRDLPPDLVSAFMATLEELQSADVLVHVVDASSPFAEEHIAAVNGILEQLELGRVPRVVAFNKVDRVRDVGRLYALVRQYDGLPVSALDRDTLRPLLSRIETVLWPGGADTDEQGGPGYVPAARTRRVSAGGVVTEQL